MAHHYSPRCCSIHIQDVVSLHSSKALHSSSFLFAAAWFFVAFQLHLANEHFNQFMNINDVAIKAWLTTVLFVYPSVTNYYLFLSPHLWLLSYSSILMWLTTVLFLVPHLFLLTVLFLFTSLISDCFFFVFPSVTYNCLLFFHLWLSTVSFVSSSVSNICLLSYSSHCLGLKTVLFILPSIHD